MVNGLDDVSRNREVQRIIKPGDLKKQDAQQILKDFLMGDGIFKDGYNSENIGQVLDILAQLKFTPDDYVDKNPVNKATASNALYKIMDLITKGTFNNLENKISGKLIKIIENVPRDIFNYSVNCGDSKATMKKLIDAGYVDLARAVTIRTFYYNDCMPSSIVDFNKYLKEKLPPDQFEKKAILSLKYPTQSSSVSAPLEVPTKNGYRMEPNPVLIYDIKTGDYYIKLFPDPAKGDADPEYPHYPSAKDPSTSKYTVKLELDENGRLREKTGGYIMAVVYKGVYIDGDGHSVPVNIDVQQQGSLNISK